MIRKGYANSGGVWPLPRRFLFSCVVLNVCLFLLFQFFYVPFFGCVGPMFVISVSSQCSFSQCIDLSLMQTCMSY